MVKLAVKIAALFAVAVGIIWLLSLNDNSRPLKQESVVRIDVAAEYTDLDYLFVGPSFMYAALDPHQFEALGHSAFNLGTMDAGPYFCDEITNDYFNASGSKPKNIFVCVSPLMFSNMADVWWRYPFHRYLHEPISNEEVILKYRPLRMVHRMYRESAQKGALNLFWEGDDPAEVDAVRQKMHNQLGYTYADDGSNVDPKNTMADPKRYAAQKAVAESYKDYIFDPRKAEHYSTLIKRWEEQGIAVTVLQIPTCESEAFYNKDYMTSYNAFLADLQAMNRPFVAKDAFEFDRLLFADMDHLNRQGGRLYTNYVLQQLNLDQ